MSTFLDATTVKVDGVDLATTGVAVLWGGSLFDAYDEVFSAVSYPGLDDSDALEGVGRPITWSVRCRVTGTDLDDAWAKLRALRRRTKPGKTVQLTRYMVGGESNAVVSLVTNARRLGDTVAWSEENDRKATIGIDFQLLGFWLPATPTTIASAAGSQSIAGDRPTRRITATLSAGAVNPVITNATNGYSFRYVGTVPVGGVVVDVAARTAYAGVVNVSSALRWGKTNLLQLDPGVNVLTVSSGTCALDYYPAYL